MVPEKTVVFHSFLTNHKDIFALSCLYSPLMNWLAGFKIAV